MTPCVGFINSVLYVYKGPPLCTKTSGTLSEPDPVQSSNRTKTEPASSSCLHCSTGLPIASAHLTQPPNISRTPGKSCSRTCTARATSSSRPASYKQNALAWAHRGPA